MSTRSRWLTAMFAAALAAGLLVGCGSSQPASQEAPSSESATESAQSTEAVESTEASQDAASAGAEAQGEEAGELDTALVTELEEALAAQDYKSVTLKVNSTFTTSGTTTTTTQEVEDGLDDASEDVSEDVDGTLDGDEDVDGYEDGMDEDGVDADDATTTTVQTAPPTTDSTTIEARAEITGSDQVGYSKVSIGGRSAEFYVSGDEVVVVSGEKVASATAGEPDLGEYLSIDSILLSQGIDISMYRNAIDSIKKTSEGDETVYTLTCALDRVSVEDVAGSSLASRMAAAGSADKCVVEYRFDAAGRWTGAEVLYNTAATTLETTATFSDYDATTIPETPSPTMTYAELTQDGTTLFNDVVTDDSGLVDSTMTENDEDYYVDYEEDYYVDEDGYYEDEYYDDTEGDYEDSDYEDTGDEEEETDESEE